MLHDLITFSQNILLDTTFKAKLGDFGFALDIPENHSGRTLVSAPLIARTEGYFAPELIGGKISSKSDVYSFGVVRNSIICIVKDDNKCTILYIGYSGNLFRTKGL